MTRKRPLGATPEDLKAVQELNALTVRTNDHLEEMRRLMLEHPPVINVTLRPIVKTNVTKP